MLHKNAATRCGLCLSGARRMESQTVRHLFNMKGKLHSSHTDYLPSTAYGSVMRFVHYV